MRLFLSIISLYIDICLLLFSVFDLLVCVTGKVLLLLLLLLYYIMMSMMMIIGLWFQMFKEEINLVIVC